jgi:hypothetical protein
MKGRVTFSCNTRHWTEVSLFFASLQLALPSRVALPQQEHTRHCSQRLGTLVLITRRIFPPFVSSFRASYILWFSFLSMNCSRDSGGCEPSSTRKHKLAPVVQLTSRNRAVYNCATLLEPKYFPSHIRFSLFLQSKIITDGAFPKSTSPF